ncbi:TfuA-like protein [Microvirga rosea]|uniref:TfuA-like protein n=1 Tax=Microvirga rosea TaxID=2715425 RepID=UPI001D0A915F|nr:TfuA-like protein [Microvirga rosea]MCB8819546.1 tfuA protein [Microvirga rosea]
MTMIVFGGPSLSKVDLSESPNVSIRPPAACGDIVNVLGEEPVAIGLVDGVFETMASPWHKEILWTMSRNVAVFGASSLGALRAVELRRFGMIGVGRIFEAYRDGTIEGDDEVALQHGPPELGYGALSEALVNIRATLAEAQSQSVIGTDEASTLLMHAKALFYKDRTWDALLSGDRRYPVKAASLDRLAGWLPQGKVDLKAEDAQELIRVMARWKPGRCQPRAMIFPDTLHWQKLLERGAR